MKM
ncbi:Protein of unknown function [Bacillus cereus]|jgi:hypothetical protein